MSNTFGRFNDIMHMTSIVVELKMFSDSNEIAVSRLKNIDEVLDVKSNDFQHEQYVADFVEADWSITFNKAVCPLYNASIKF